MDDLRERIKAAILDACYSYYEEIDFEKAADAVLAILREQEPVAWATHHDEPMFFPSEKEAWKYCDDDETPIPLYAAPMPASVPDGWQLVPVEPTKAMCKAGERVRRYDKHNNDEFMPDIVYASMLAAAPKPGDE